MSVEAQVPNSLKPVYVFLDEGGNLDFGETGSKFFTLSAVWLARPFPFETALTDLRFDLIESGLDLQQFHASDDRQATRDQVFRRAIVPHLSALHAEILVIEKQGVPTAFRGEALFYPIMVAALVRAVVSACEAHRWSELIVITDRVPINRKRKAIEKAVKSTLSAMLPDDVRHRVLHHDSKSCAGLQVADYINWAVYRAASCGDERSFELVAPCVRRSVEFRTVVPKRNDKK